jgi:hypothetical protein
VFNTYNLDYNIAVVRLSQILSINMSFVRKWGHQMNFEVVRVLHTCEILYAYSPANHIYENTYLVHDHQSDSR